MTSTRTAEFVRRLATPDPLLPLSEAGSEYDGNEYAALPVKYSVFVIRLCCNVLQMWVLADNWSAPVLHTCATVFGSGSLEPEYASLIHQMNQRGAGARKPPSHPWHRGLAQPRRVRANGPSSTTCGPGAVRQTVLVLRFGLRLKPSHPAHRTRATRCAKSSTQSNRTPRNQARASR